MEKMTKEKWKEYAEKVIRERKLIKFTLGFRDYNSNKLVPVEFKYVDEKEGGFYNEIFIFDLDGDVTAIRFEIVKFMGNRLIAKIYNDYFSINCRDKTIYNPIPRYQKIDTKNLDAYKLTREEAMMELI